MDTRLCIIQPDVAGDGGGVVLSPFIFKSLAVLVEELMARLVEADRFGRGAQHLLRTPSRCRYFVKLGHGRSGEKSAACRVLDGCGKQDILSVRSECGGYLTGGVGSEPLGGSAVCRHHEYVEVAVSVAGKGYLFAVRRPYGGTFVALLGSKLCGGSTFGRHLVDVSFVAECDFRTVGRDLHIAHPERRGGMSGNGSKA